MAKIFKGINLLPYVAPAPIVAPAATYAAGPLVDGLQLITAISNEPAVLFSIPTGKSKEIMKDKTQTRLYFFGGSENGEMVETIAAVSGNLTACLARAANDDSIYDPAIDIMLRAASELNKYVYLRFDQLIGRTVTGKYRYHTKAGLFLVKGREAQQAEGQTVEVPFELAGQGDLIDGYFDK